MADLVSEGNLGLLRAAELFDPKFGVAFSTYAAVWIKQRMHRAITAAGPSGPHSGLACRATAAQAGPPA